MQLLSKRELQIIKISIEGEVAWQRKNIREKKFTSKRKTRIESEIKELDVLVIKMSKELSKLEPS